MTKSLCAALVLGAAVLLQGCAAMRSVSNEVSSFGEWPTDRRPGSYAFERLPSQQARANEADALEAAAAAALAKAGFSPVAAGQPPDVLVQVGATDARVVSGPWDDPLWWRGGFGYWRHGPWMSPRWGMSMRMEAPRYERQVGVLIRDRASGRPLYETRASSEGNMPAEGPILAAMFQAALMDFPKLGMNPRRVVVDIPPAPKTP